MNKFTKRIIYTYILVFSIIAILRYTNIISQEFLISSIYAGVLNLINAFTAVKLFKISYKSSSSLFMIYNLGGFGIRLMAIILSIIIVIKFLNIDKYGFILVFFLFYFISLIFEVVFYLRTTNNK